MRPWNRECYIDGNRTPGVIAAFEEGDRGLLLAHEKDENGHTVWDFEHRHPKVIQLWGKVEIRKPGVN